MGRPRGADDEESAVELSAIEQLFEGEADPAGPSSDGEVSPTPAPGPGASDA